MLPEFEHVDTKAVVIGLTIIKSVGDVVWFREKNAFQIHHEGLSQTYPSIAPEQKYLIHENNTRTVMDAGDFNQQYTPRLEIDK